MPAESQVRAKREGVGSLAVIIFETVILSRAKDPSGFGELLGFFARLRMTGREHDL
jgi:hypothetical protein